MSTLLRAALPPSAEDQALGPPPDASHANPRLGPLGEPFSRFSALPPVPATECEESLITDKRANLTPAQMVEQKLVSLLKGKAVSVSQIQMVRSIRARG